MPNVNSVEVYTELPLRGGSRGFPSAAVKGKRRKTEPKETPSCLIPRLLVIFTRQLEIFKWQPCRYELYIDKFGNVHDVMHDVLALDNIYNEDKGPRTVSLP